MKQLSIALLVAILAMTVACGSSESDAESPAATPFIPPTSQSFADVSAASADLIGLGERRDFPAELLLTSELLQPEQVESLWYSFLSDARIVSADGGTVIDLCSRFGPAPLTCPPKADPG